MDTNEIQMFISDEENLHSPSNASADGHRSQEQSPKSHKHLLNTQELLAYTLEKELGSSREILNSNDSPSNTPFPLEKKISSRSYNYVKVLDGDPNLDTQ